MEETTFTNPYSKKDYKIFENMFKETINSKFDKNRIGFTVALKQLKAMNLSPFLELAYFGRTSEDWENQLKR